MKYRAFQISAVHANGSAINGTVHVERTGKSYSFDFLADRTDDGAPLVRLYQAGTRPRVVPLNQLRDVRNAVREHFAKVPPPAAPVASDPVPADVPCYLAVSTDAAGVETVMGVFRVAEHASDEAAEMAAGDLCERIERAAPGAVCHVRANPDVNGAFVALAEAEAALQGARYTRGVEWSRAFDTREAARDRAVSLDPVRFARTYPSQAFAYRHLLPADMVARIEAAEDDAAMRAAVGAPAMVPQVSQQQQANAGRDRLVAYTFTLRGEDSGDTWTETVVASNYDAARDKVLEMDTAEHFEIIAESEAPAMVPQPAQQQQGRDTRRGIARCDGPGLWQIGIYSVERDPKDASTWHAKAVGPGTIGNGYVGSYPTLAAAYLSLTGEPMPGASRE